SNASGGGGGVRTRRHAPVVPRRPAGASRDSLRCPPVVPRRAAGASRDSLHCPTSHRRRFVGFPPLRFGHVSVTLRSESLVCGRDLQCRGAPGDEGWSRRGLSSSKTSCTPTRTNSTSSA